MSEERIEKTQRKLERITRKWWFFLLLLLIQFLIPPYASKGYAWPEMGTVIGEILGHAIVFNYPALYPVFKLIPIILVIALILFGNRATEAFTIYVAITYILFAFLQNIAVTDKYGLGIVTVNLIMFLFVAAVWLWEAIAKKKRFLSPKTTLVEILGCSSRFAGILVPSRCRYDARFQSPLPGDKCSWPYILYDDIRVSGNSYAVLS